MAEKPIFTQHTQVQNFKHNELNKVHRDRSISVLWEQSYFCPCRDKVSRQPNPSCHICNGRGIAFREPKNLDMIVQSQEKGVFNGDLGLLDTGTAIGTPQAEFDISFRDRITLPDAKVNQSYIFDVNKRRVEYGVFIAYDVNSIEFATTTDGEIFEGKDYTFDYVRNRFYPKEHLIDKNISFIMKTTLRYIVADLLKEHRYDRFEDGSVKKLYRKLLLKREDIFIEREAFSQGLDNDEVSGLVETKREPNYDGLNGFFRNPNAIGDTDGT